MAKKPRPNALDERIDDDDTGFDINAREPELMHPKPKPLTLAQIREAAKARGHDTPK